MSGLVSRPETIWTRHRLHNARQWHDAQRVFVWMEQNHYVGRQMAGNQHNTFAALVWSKT